jgi:hypothetical protein
MEMKPICVACHRFFKPAKIGFYFTEGMPADGAKPGLEDAARWTPYKVWVGDIYECAGCGTQIIVGAPPDRIAEHYESDFAETRRKLSADQFQVNDC